MGMARSVGFFSYWLWIQKEAETLWEEFVNDSQLKVFPAIAAEKAQWGIFFPGFRDDTLNHIFPITQSIMSLFFFFPSLRTQTQTN